MNLRRRLYDDRTVRTLRTGAAFRKAYDRSEADCTAILDAQIAAGRGHFTNAHTRLAAYAGDALSMLELQLRDENRTLAEWARRFFQREPYLVYKGD